MKLTIYAIALMFGGCATVDEPELAEEVAALEGHMRILLGDGDPADCTTGDVTQTQLFDFKRRMVEVMTRARSVAHAPAFHECLRSTMTTGIAIRHGRWAGVPSPDALTFGPYQQHLGDLGAAVTGAMPLDRKRDLYASRVISEMSSPHDVELVCMRDHGGAAGGPTIDRAMPERMRISKDYILTPDPLVDASLVGVIWHEAMHTRGYWHAGDLPDLVYRSSIPVIARACMEDVYARSEDQCGMAACTTPTGAAGRMVLQTYVSGGCTCVSDPADASLVPSLVDSWTLPGLAQVAVDGAGNGYILADASRWPYQSVYQRNGHAWTEVAHADAIAANADAVAWRSGLGRGPRTWTIKPRVGPIETEQVASLDSSPALDGFGGFVRSAGGRVLRRLPGVTGWQDLGAGDAVFANADMLYATNANNIWRLGAGGWTALSSSAAQFTVDSYGTLYSLSLDGQSLQRNRGATWDLVNGQDTAIAAGDNLFTRSTNGWVYRFRPGGYWQAVAMCDAIAAGARSLYCQRGSTLELYEY